MAKTLCPACGSSPIPDGADICPSCGEPITFFRADQKAHRGFIDPRKDAEATAATAYGGVITGAVTAHPYPPALAFLAGGVIWFLRQSGILLDSNEPTWLLLFAVLDLLVLIVILVNVGPVKVLAFVAAAAQLLGALWLGREDWTRPLQLFFILYTAAVLAMVAGEAGFYRRMLALSVSGAAAVAATAVMGTLGMREAAAELNEPRLGFKLRLPSGYAAFTRDEVRPSLQLPAGDALAFGNSTQGVYGAVIVRMNSAMPLISGCEALHQALGAAEKPKVLPRRAPPGLGPSSLVYALRTASGAVGRLACGKREDGTFLALAVVQAGADPSSAEATAERAFVELGSGLALR